MGWLNGADRLVRRGEGVVCAQTHTHTNIKRVAHSEIHGNVWEFMHTNVLMKWRASTLKVWWWVFLCTDAKYCKFVYKCVQIMYTHMHTHIHTHIKLMLIKIIDVPQKKLHFQLNKLITGF